MREPHDFTIEVCIECGAQLNRSGNGRCPVDRNHWSRGGMVVRVVPRPVAEQDVVTARRFSLVTESVRSATPGDDATPLHQQRAHGSIPGFPPDATTKEGR